MSLARKGYRFLPVALLSLIVDILAFLMLGISATFERDLWNAIIPLSIAFLLTWYLATEDESSSPSQPA
jgi:hypothetical protein